MTRMIHNRYTMAFTTGGLFCRESVRLAELFLDRSDWNAVRDQVIAENLLQARTVKTLKHICREVLLRLKTLSRSELEFLVESRHQEQVYLLWIAVCRRYSFIAEFAVELLRERYITLKADVRREDFDSFFHRKSEWHPELDGLRPSTRAKLRQVLFKMLREADLLSTNHLIHAALLSPGLIDLIKHSDVREALYFPIFESDLQGLVK